MTREVSRGGAEMNKDAGDGAMGIDVTAAVIGIVEDMRGRSGFDAMWDQCDEETQAEIFGKWKSILGEAKKPPLPCSDPTPGPTAVTLGRDCVPGQFVTWRDVQGWTYTGTLREWDNGTAMIEWPMIQTPLIAVKGY